jgi:hypothetical protein
MKGTDWAVLILALIVAALVVLPLLQDGPPAPPRPVPAPAPVPVPLPPKPCPGPGPCPKPRLQGEYEAKVGGPKLDDGTEVDCDLPPALHVKNRGGSDGAGLCVFASLRHSGQWHNEPVLTGLFEWMFSKPGGGYPDKVTRCIETYSREKGLPQPLYLQIEGDDLDVLKAACKSGRMPGVTYSYSPTGRYGGQRIAHMVTLVHADDRWFAILDNNYPGENAIEWMDPATFLKVYTGGRSGWAVIPLSPGPPPPPKNG